MDSLILIKNFSIRDSKLWTPKNDCFWRSSRTFGRWCRNPNSSERSSLRTIFNFSIVLTEVRLPNSKTEFEWIQAKQFRIAGTLHLNPIWICLNAIFRWSQSHFKVPPLDRASTSPYMPVRAGSSPRLQNRCTSLGYMDRALLASRSLSFVYFVKLYKLCK